MRERIAEYRVLSCEYRVRALSRLGTQYSLLLARFLFGQPYLRGVQLLLDFGESIRILLGGNGFVPFLDGAIPVSGGQFEAAGLLVEISQMFLHCRIGAHVGRGFVEIVFGEIVLA